MKSTLAQSHGTGGTLLMITVMESHIGRALPRPIVARRIARMAAPAVTSHRHTLKEGMPMFKLQEGQCGLCVHYGEHHPEEQSQLVQIRVQHEAPEDLVEECGHPRRAPLHLMVTPISGCDGFEPAPEAKAA